MGGATIIPIPKKGTSVTATTEGGMLYWMYIVGKVVARVIQERLQRLEEQELPETQCGFCKGRSCSDMILLFAS